jgi:glutamine synthetase adenylyltransferase
MSRGIDWILNHAKDAIGQAEAMACPPDDATAAMAALLAEAVHHIDDAVAMIGERSDAVGICADAAVKAERRLEKVYRAAMGTLAGIDDPRAVMGRQELYRRCSRMGETAVDIAERLIYAGAQGELITCR